jgi:GTP-binding protein
MGRIVAIIGRPNVGKSTLFNRITETRDAIVDEVAGVTRDRHYGKGEWCGKEFTLIDTGGFSFGSDDVFEDEIRNQVTIAMEEADVLLFVVDVTMGITDLDEAVADLARRARKPVFLVVNKVDKRIRDRRIAR